MQPVVKGMVQVAGTTYRIVRLQRGRYEVVRILDNVGVGEFSNSAGVEVTTGGIEPALMREIAKAAMHNAKTSWVGRLALG